jgi:peptidase MA superfamily protein
VTAVAWPQQMSMAIALARIAGRPTKWPGLGPVDPGPIRLIVVPDSRRLDSLTGGRAPSWGAAIALPDAHTILLRADAGDLSQTLRHELAHLALHRKVQGRVPLWFDEGYAGWAAGEWERLGSLELNLSVVWGAIPDLRSLDGALRGAPSTADAAYALAVSAVLELARRNPSGTLEPLLSSLSAGEDFDAAVRKTTGLTIGRFEESWQRAVKQRYSIGVWLVAGGGWLIMALLVAGLVRLRRRRDLPRRAALDEGWDVEAEDAEGSELDRTP